VVISSRRFANLSHIKNGASICAFLPPDAGDRKTAGASKRMTHQNELSSTRLIVIVIVIGGDLAVRRALKFWLEIEGLTVHSYATEAELLAEGELARCDCLVVDEKSPETSGLRLIAQLRDRNFSAPAILVTSQPSLSLRDQAERVGVPIVEKPLLGNGLLDTIRSAIGNRVG
jgi:two-component system, LuxR family, response regulator FixJ